jgi:hypothetical protein
MPISNSKEALLTMINLLDNYCYTIDSAYILDSAFYKKITMDDTLEIFLRDLEPHYYKSKLNYLKECNTFNKFLTIVRQICNHNNIELSKKVVYEKSKYKPIYNINKSLIGIW